MTETTTELPIDAPESGESFGAWLRQQREMREIHLSEIAERTKISQRYLQAMEEDNFELLPGPIFVKGFLREYAKYVGLNPDEVVNFYLSTQVQPEETAEVAAEDERPTDWGWGRGLIVALLAILALAVLTFALFSYLGREHRAGGLPADTAPTDTTAMEDGYRVEEGGSEGDAQGALEGTAREEGTAVPAATPTAEGPPPTPPRAPLVVTLDFSEDCWVEIVVDDGARRVDQRFVQGESLTLEARDHVDLRTLGNAGGVSLQVNGRPWPLAARSQEVLRDLRIDVEAARRLSRGEGMR